MLKISFYVNKLSTFFLLLIFQMAFATECINNNSQQLIEEMREQIHQLNESQNFSFIDLGICVTDLQILNDFNINSTAQYDRFASLDLLDEELPAFLNSIGNNDKLVLQKITTIISKVTHDVCAASNKTSAWVCVRVSTPDRDFDTPRWHTDGYYYPPYTGFAIKFVATLKGKSTLFCQLPKALRKTFNIYREDREFLNALLKSCAIECPKPGFGSFFIVGDESCSAVHSEPKIDDERLFFSVLPGNDEEIEALRKRWCP